MKKLTNALFLTLLLINSNCKNDHPVPCGSTEMILVPLSYVFKINSGDAWLQNIDASSNLVNLVIRNLVDYEKYVGTRPGVDRPVVDFNNYLMLAGKIVWPNCGIIDDQSLVIQCNEAKLTTLIKDNFADGVVCGAETTLFYFIEAKTQSLNDVRYEVRKK